MTYILNDRTPRHYGHVKTALSKADKLEQSAVSDKLYRCPGCGVDKPPFCLIDIRSLPVALTDGSKWACDGCWNEWTRPGGQMQKTYNNKPFTKRAWLEAHGAPQEVLDKQDERDVLKLKRLEKEGVSAQEIEKHMDIIKIRIKKDISK